MAILSDSNFTGYYNIAQPAGTTIVVDSFSDTFCPVYLAKLLGAKMASDVIADLSGGNVPTNPDYVVFWDALQFDHCGEVYQSFGAIEMLTGFVYWEMMVDAKVQVSQLSGVSRSESEIAKSSRLPEAQIAARYNRAVDSAKAIQAYILLNLSKYPDFNGQEILYT